MKKALVLVLTAIYLAEAYGYNVGWNGNTSTVTISKGKVETVIPETKPAASTNMKLDPLPTMSIEKQPDWHMSLTPIDKMSDERLMAEHYALEKFIWDNDVRTDPAQIREMDLWSAIRIRDLEDRYYEIY